MQHASLQRLWWQKSFVRPLTTFTIDVSWSLSSHPLTLDWSDSLGMHLLLVVMLYFY